MNQVREQELKVASCEKKLIGQQLKLLKKGTHQIIGLEELEDKLLKAKQMGKPLVIKLGLDPTAPDLHLGHTVVLRKIRQFQDMGHKAFLIIGDFTGRIGDPTGKEKSRPQLTQSQVLANADTYKKQLDKVLDPDKTILCFNSEWLDAMSIGDLLEILSKQTLARILERDGFKKRMKNGDPIGMHELLYPVFQGLDSLNIKADVEIGGTDQTFNILMGRDMQAKEGQEKQVAIFMPILGGINSEEKMSKSLGNCIGINETPNVMFEKLMTIGDGQIIEFFELATDIGPDVIEDFRQQLAGGRTNPKNIKMRLAQEIVSLYHSKEKAIEAKENFVRVFAKGKVPKEMPTFNWKEEDTLLSFLVENKVVQSKSEVRRLVAQKGLKINGHVILEAEIGHLKAGDVIRLGKKRFIGIK